MTVRLSVRVTPGASRDEVKAVSADLVEIRLRARAVEGQANEALIRFLADVLGIRSRDVTIERGATVRRKIVAVEGLAMEEILTRLGGQR